MITALLITASILGVSGEGARIFEEGNTAYRQGNYAEAAQKYGELHTMHGINSPVLLYNLGNTHYMQNQLGKAVLYYEAALVKDPDLEAARHNLEQALGETRRSLPLPDIRQVSSNPMIRYYPLSPSQSLLLVHGCLFAAILLLLVRQWRPQPRYAWAMRACIVGACILYGCAFAGDRAVRTAPKLAVAQLEEVPVYFGMNELDAPRFLLYEGDRVLADRVEDKWIRLQAHGGERGWAQKEAFGIVEYGVW